VPEACKAAIRVTKTCKPGKSAGVYDRLYPDLPVAVLGPAAGIAALGSALLIASAWQTRTCGHAARWERRSPLGVVGAVSDRDPSPVAESEGGLPGSVFPAV